VADLVRYRANVHRKSSLVMSAAHWLDRVKEARVLTETFRRPGTRLEMLKLAESYRLMAQMAENALEGLDAVPIPGFQAVGSMRRLGPSSTT
jgi:hypothetical protein